MPNRIAQMSGRELRRLKADGVPPDQWMPGYRLAGRLVTTLGRKDAFLFAPLWLYPLAKAWLYVVNGYLEADLCRVLLALRLLRGDDGVYLVLWTNVHGCSRVRWFWERA